MRKIRVIVLSDFLVLLAYTTAFFISYRLGSTIEDIRKLLPTALASAGSNVITLTLALCAIVKDTARLSLGGPEQDDWDVIVPVFIDCRMSDGIVLEGIAAEGLELISVQVGENVRDLPLEVAGGASTELRASFSVLKGYQDRIVDRSQLRISLHCRKIGAERGFLTQKSCRNVFWRH